MDEETRYQPDVAKEYRNDRIAVFWEPKYCIHTANCLLGNPRIFDAVRRPWIDLTDADADEVAQIVMSCPTGALHLRRLDGGED
ncbi:MAG: (4Fe-4S)-binding protein, partial [Gammaproteobacteria bacterium]